MKRLPEPRLTAASKKFIYDPATGDLYSRETGKKYRTISRGYATVVVGKYRYGAHRIAWLIYYGYWPTKNIDHIDGNRSNNSISNLRLLSQSSNVRIGKREYRPRSGVRGVSKHALVDRWVARICVDGKPVYLGLHSTIEEAAAARKRAEDHYGLQ